MSDATSTIVYVLNKLTGCVSQVNKTSSMVQKYKADPNKKVFSSWKSYHDYKLKHKK